MKAFRVEKIRGNNPEALQLRKKLNDLFIAARKPKPKFFNKLANDLKNPESVDQIFKWANDYLNRVRTVTDIQELSRPKSEPKKVKKHNIPKPRIVKKK